MNHRREGTLLTSNPTPLLKPAQLELVTQPGSEYAHEQESEPTEAIYSIVLITLTVKLFSCVYMELHVLMCALLSFMSLLLSSLNSSNSQHHLM